MTDPIDYHCQDQRTLQQKQDNLIALNLIQSILEHEISSYALENPLNLYDEENQVIVRKLEFSRGLKHHQIVIAPDGLIRAISNEFPDSLICNIHTIIEKLNIQNQ